MNISRAQADKLVVGTTDVGYLPTDRNPVGTTVLNGPVFVGLPVAAPIYKAVLNVGPPAPPSSWTWYRTCEGRSWFGPPDLVKDPLRVPRILHGKAKG